MSRTAAIAPTKTHRDENFPVASHLIARPLRRAVLAFYRYVRAADDIADDGDLSGDEKLARLDTFERALIAGDADEPLAAALHEMDAAFGAGIEEARMLLDAFRQDAVKTRYADWAELRDYCRRSADPVGRFLLRLHGEHRQPDGARAQKAADALCTALQILNHLQDLEKDRAALDRIYLPTPWLDLAGGEAAFFDPANGEGRRAVIDATLDRVDRLLDEARFLPGMVRSRRLAAESAVTLELAVRLAARLRSGDPVVTRVKLGKADVLRATGTALARLPLRRRDPAPGITGRIVAASGSSFRIGMAALPGERRRAIHAVYAFCRVIDDIADGCAPVAEKRAFLATWRAEIDALPDAPQTAIGRELARAMRAHDLPRAEFHALLDGMEADAQPRVRIEDDAAFALYCRRVAGAVGVLSIHIFGAPQARDFAITLGHTLQTVNVLRDVADDAAMERVYVPLSRLAALGLADAPAETLIRDPRFAEVCEALAQEAQAGFVEVDAMLAGLDRARLKPAILMMEGYRKLFDRMQARGFTQPGERLRLGWRDKLALAGKALRRAPA
ncbi:MAG: squalene/phytoene synthase family protein [Salinarimonas sp.]|nr:squalene/phytoene synthase family protein [Salinarimonas sp.]